MQPKEKLEILKAKVEEALGRKLVVTLNTLDEEGCEDEEHGHFLQCEFAEITHEFPDAIHEDSGIVGINIHEDETVQFYCDANPFPALSNTEGEKHDMLNLNPCPTHVMKITEADMKNFLVQINEYFVIEE